MPKTKTTSPEFVYASHGKQEYRKYVQGQFDIHSLGDFHGKWLEPIGAGALTFDSLLATGRIDEASLIGLDKNPRDIAGSRQNIEQCRTKFPKAQFFCQDWREFCLQYRDPIRYIVYDLYTSTFGPELLSNLQAIFSLVQQSLKYHGQVLLAVTADLQATMRHKKDVQDFEHLLKRVFESPTIRHSRISCKDMFLYTSNRDQMGVLIIEFFNNTVP